MAKETIEETLKKISKNVKKNNKKNKKRWYRVGKVLTKDNKKIKLHPEMKSSARRTYRYYGVNKEDWDGPSPRQLGKMRKEKFEEVLRRREQNRGETLLESTQTQPTAPQSGDLGSHENGLGPQQMTLPGAVIQEDSLPGAESLVEGQHQPGDPGPLTTAPMGPTADAQVWYHEEVGFIWDDWDLPGVGAAEELLF